MAPLGDFERSPNGSNPRIVGWNFPETFYRSFFALALETLRFKKMSWGAAQGRDNLPAIEFPESELAIKGPQSVNLLTDFVKPGGSSCDQNLRLWSEVDLKSELTNGRVKALEKTDCLAWRDSRKSKQTSCFIIIRRSNSSEIIKIWSLHNPSKIGVLCLSERHTTWSGV